jgi:hypothetical protein
VIYVAKGEYFRGCPGIQKSVLRRSPVARGVKTYTLSVRTSIQFSQSGETSARPGIFCEVRGLGVVYTVSALCRGGVEMVA